MSSLGCRMFVESYELWLAEYGVVSKARLVVKRHTIGTYEWNIICCKVDDPRFKVLWILQPPTNRWLSMETNYKSCAKNKLKVFRIGFIRTCRLSLSNGLSKEPWTHAVVQWSCGAPTTLIQGLTITCKLAGLKWLGATFFINSLPFTIYLHDPQYRTALLAVAQRLSAGS